MSGATWFIAASVGVIAIAFVVLVIFLAMNLISLQHTLKDLEFKLHAFDPLFRVVSSLGETMEKKATSVLSESSRSAAADEVCEACSSLRRDRTSPLTNSALDIAEWALMGLAIWQKFKKRK